MPRKAAFALLTEEGPSPRGSGNATTLTTMTVTKDQGGEEEEEEEEEGRVDGFVDVQDEARAVAVAAIGHVAAKKRDVPRGGKAG